MVKIWFFSFRYWKSFSYPPRILQYAVNWAGTLWPKAMQFLDALASLETTQVGQWVSHPQFRQSLKASL